MATSGQLKTETLMIRISSEDKEELKKVAMRRGMTMSELVTYLVQREIDWEKMGKISKEEIELKAIADGLDMPLPELLLYFIRKSMDLDKYQDR